MKKLLFLAIASMALFSACKKKDVEKTTGEKILGRWSLVSNSFNGYYSGSTHVANYIGIASDYIEFKSDGKFTASYQGITQIQTYSLPSDSKMIIGGENHDIRTLTDNSLILYMKIPGVITGEYEEQTLTYKK
jgi:hypothetical protein